MLDEIYQNPSNKVNTKESVERLHAAGAHFVLCRGGKDPKEYKKPCWDKWQLRVPALDVALSHLGRGPSFLGVSRLRAWMWTMATRTI